MKTNNAYKFSLWGLFGILGYLGFKEFYQINVLAYVGTQNIWESRRFIAFLFVSILSAAAWLGVMVAWLKKWRSFKTNHFNNLPTFIRWAVITLFILLPGLIKWYLPLPPNLNMGFWMELLLIYSLALMAAQLIRKEQANAGQNLLTTAILIMASGAAHIILLKLCQVTSYPFTLFWSEGNRFFDYSVLFGRYRYIIAAGDKIKAFITWGMSLPWALPFILPNLSIGAFRLWYQLVWILPTAFLGWTVAREKDLKSQAVLTGLVFATWTFLFLDQGPIYTPLILAAILTVLAVRAKLPLGCFLVLLAACYARVSRWTWAYGPGLWAGMLALLIVEKPSFKKADLHKLIKPVALGVSGYIGGQILGPIAKHFTFPTVKLIPNVVTATSRQPLLWDRLFPNPTYAPGILYGLLWACLPVVILLAALIITKAWKTNWMQNMTILIIAGAFLTVGLIASVKIGGGSNLHNLDNFLVTMVLVMGAAVSRLLRERFALENHPLLLVLTCIALIAPMTYGLQGGARLNLPAQDEIQKTIDTIQNTVSEFKNKGEILFIDQRQLLTFGLVENVTLVDDYEKKYMMDQAMANNKEYFKGFFKDLQAKRFALIVNEPSNYVIRGSESSFGEENDAYVNWVTAPLLCTYEPIYTSREIGIELLVPRQTPLQGLDCESILNP
jgi:hypothetical protein